MTFESPSIAKGATAADLMDGKGLRTITGTRGNSSIVLVPLCNSADKKHHDQIYAQILAANKNGAEVLYFQPFSVKGWRWYEILYRILIVPTRIRMRYAGISRRLTAIPDERLPKQVVRLDFVNHVRSFPDPDLYRTWVLGATRALWPYFLNPRKAVLQGISEYIATGGYSKEDEHMRVIGHDFVMAQTRLYAGGHNYVVFYAPAGIADAVAKQLEKDGYELDIAS